MAVTAPKTNVEHAPSNVILPCCLGCFRFNDRICNRLMRSGSEGSVAK